MSIAVLKAMTLIGACALAQACNFKCNHEMLTHGEHCSLEGDAPDGRMRLGPAIVNVNDDAGKMQPWQPGNPAAPPYHRPSKP